MLCAKHSESGQQSRWSISQSLIAENLFNAQRLRDGWVGGSVTLMLVCVCVFVPNNTQFPCVCVVVVMLMGLSTWNSLLVPFQYHQQRLFRLHVKLSNKWHSCAKGKPDVKIALN